jgi:hypothetical protein
VRSLTTTLLNSILQEISCEFHPFLQMVGDWLVGSSSKTTHVIAILSTSSLLFSLSASLAIHPSKPNYHTTMCNFKVVCILVRTFVG